MIDNHSSDDSVPQIQRYIHSRSTISNVSLVCLGENLGYAAGNNVGVAQALDESAKYIWILNNDTWVAADALAEMIKFMEAHPEVALSGSCLLDAYADGRVQTMGGRFSFLGTPHQIDAGKEWFSLPPEPIWPDYVFGASMLLRSDFVRKKGSFDSHFSLTVRT